DNKYCYEIIYYPRRKGELTFRGSLWVNDSIWAVKKIDMTASEDMNVNWIRGIYMEQEFDSMDDTTLLLTKDVFRQIFLFAKKKKQEVCTANAPRSTTIIYSILKNQTNFTKVS